MVVNLCISKRVATCPGYTPPLTWSHCRIDSCYDGWMDEKIKSHLWFFFLEGERKPSKPKQTHKAHVKHHTNGNSSSESNLRPWSWGATIKKKKKKIFRVVQQNSIHPISKGLWLQIPMMPQPYVSRSQGSKTDHALFVWGLTYAFFLVSHFILAYHRHLWHSMSSSLKTGWLALRKHVLAFTLPACKWPYDGESFLLLGNNKWLVWEAKEEGGGLLR